MENKKYLNTHECGKLINRTDHSVRRLVMRGKIPFRKAGGRLMFPTDEILKWVESSPGLSVEEIRNGNS